MGISTHGEDIADMAVLKQQKLRGSSPTERAGAHPQQGVSGPRLFSREGLICASVVVLAILLIWPVAGVGVQDDPIYTFTALDFARTGHFIFHGWASPMLGWQALWGALFARLFGATFTAVRLSMVPVAFLSALLYHAILRRFGLNPAHATFGALAFALGPLFLPLSTSFMTDVPGLFAVLVCLYLCQLAIDAPNDARAIFFLTMAAASNVLLGTARQIAWLGLLVMVPSCVWILRRRRYALQVGAVLWLLGVISIHLMTEWFARQPYTAPEKLMASSLNVHLGSFAAGQFIRLGMTTLLFLLPILTLGLRSLWPLRRRMALGMAAALLLVAALIGLFHRRGLGHVVTFPWLGVNFGLHGILQDGLFGSDPPIPDIWQKLLFLFVVISAVASLETFLAYRGTSIPQHVSPKRLTSWRQISILLLPFLVFNCVFLLPRAAFFRLYDRYLPEIVAVLLIFILRWHQDHVSTRIPLLATATVALISILTVADTHDLFATYRAQTRLVSELRNAGISRTQIRGGLAFDLATQVSAWGYVNDPRMINPPGAYKPRPEAAPFVVNGVLCDYSLQHLFPALYARYDVLFLSSSPCVAPTSFPPQTYRAWLPPLKRQLFVHRVIFAADHPRDAGLLK